MTDETTREAWCIGDQFDDTRGVFYSYGLHPPMRHGEMTVYQVVVARNAERTAILIPGDDRPVVTYRPMWGAPMAPDEALRTWAGYVETTQSKLRRISGAYSITATESPRLTLDGEVVSVPSSVAALWPALDETARLVALALLQAWRRDVKIPDEWGDDHDAPEPAADDDSDDETIDDYVSLSGSAEAVAALVRGLQQDKE